MLLFRHFKYIFLCITDETCVRHIVKSAIETHTLIQAHPQFCRMRLKMAIELADLNMMCLKMKIKLADC